jgi:hypothetical protein
VVLRRNLEELGEGIQAPNQCLLLNLFLQVGFDVAAQSPLWNVIVVDDTWQAPQAQDLS